MRGRLFIHHTRPHPIKNMLPKTLLIPALALSASSFCHAAPITWGAATDTTGKADLIEGAIVTALNGGDTAVTITGGGVSGTSDYNFTASNYTTIDFTPTGADAADTPQVRVSANQYTPEIITPTGDPDFDNLIVAATDARGTGGGITTGTLLLDGLNPGTNYQVQVFYNDQRTNNTATATDTRAMTYGDGLGNTVAVAAGDPALDVQTAHYGQFAVGSFTADAATQTLTMDSTMGVTPFGNVHYTAILVTGPAGINVPPALGNVAVEVLDETPAGTLVATLVATDNNAGDTLTYTLTAGDPGGVFALDMSTGDLSTAALIDIDTTASYQLTVEVSDGTAITMATVDVTIAPLAGTAAITWGTAQNTTSVDDLLTGTVAYARNGGNPVTVAGINFDSVDLGNGFLADSYGAVGGITSTGDVDFDTLIAGFTFGGGSGSAELPGLITGLTVGRTYSVQVFFNDQRPNQSGRIMSVSDSVGNSADFAAGAILGTGESDDYGQFVVGTFVANFNTQYLEVAPSGGGFGNSHLNAILVVEGTGVADEAEITDIVYDQGADEVSITWTSNPGTLYALRYSFDLIDFTADIDDAVNASAGATTTFTFTLPIDLIGEPRVFFRVEVE